MIPESLFRTSPVITRYPEPVLTCKDVPYDSNLTFNAGVIKENGRYIMLFRNDYGCTREQFEQEGRNFAGTNIGLAFSDDGIHWQVESQPVLELRDEEISRAYDPRITRMDGQYYVCFAVDTRHGVRGGIFSTHDFHHFAPISLSVPDKPQYGALPGKDRRKIRAPGTPHAGVFHGRPFLRYLVVRFAGPRVLGQFPPGAQLPGCALLQRQERPWRAAAQDRRGLAGDLPFRGRGPRARQKRLGRRLAQALCDRRDAAGSGRSFPGDRPVQSAADGARRPGRANRRLPQQTRSSPVA